MRNRSPFVVIRSAAVIVRAVLCAALLLAPRASALAQQPAGEDRFVGTWLGTLPTGAVELRLAFDIRRGPAGALTASIISLDQGNATMPAIANVRGDSIELSVASAHATFSGIINAGRDSIRGNFTQGGRALPLIEVRVAALPGVDRPQEPKPPFPYETADVTIESVPGVRLAGTLTLPQGKGPFPAVVLVSGSGAQDRDEAMVGHRPFLVLADYLARHGIASLRYDDRGFAKSTGSFSRATTADFADDAEAAFRFLRSRQKIAPKHVGILGHSEGGEVAPMVAARNTDVAFVVLLAGPGVRGDSLLLAQSAALGASMGAPSAVIEQNSRINAALYEAVRGARDSADADARVTAAIKQLVAGMPEAQQGTTVRLLMAAATDLLAPWTRYFIAYDPRPALEKLHVPVLALNGTLDLQVPYQQNLAAIEAALKAGGNRDYEIVEMPGLNHLFQTAVTGNPSEYPTISETMAPAVLEKIAAWITAHTKR
jgi:pimeloyl-ACP methyl ester carboxylesterase